MDIWNNSFFKTQIRVRFLDFLFFIRQTQAGTCTLKQLTGNYTIIMQIDTFHKDSSAYANWHDIDKWDDHDILPSRTANGSFNAGRLKAPIRTSQLSPPFHWPAIMELLHLSCTVASASADVMQKLQLLVSCYYSALNDNVWPILVFYDLISALAYIFSAPLCAERCTHSMS